MATIAKVTDALPGPVAVQGSSYIPRGTVTAELKFYDPPADGSKPWNYVEQPTDGTPKRNFGDADIPVTITDIRGRESLYNLDDNAFTTLKTDSGADIDFTSDESIKKNYYPEVEEILLRNVPGAKRIFVFDHTVRLINGNRPPVLRAHIDQNEKAAIGRLNSVLPDEAEHLLESRVRTINVWRPLNGPVQCSPLAFADSKTVQDEELITVEHRYPDRTGETLSVKHANEKWYYWSGIENNERILLECFDNEKGGRVPHTAFVDPRSPMDGKQRESIEVRALVFG